MISIGCVDVVFYKSVIASILAKAITATIVNGILVVCA